MIDRSFHGNISVNFVRSVIFHNADLGKAFDKRKSLELKLDDAKLEHESFRNLLDSSKSEHASVSKMLSSARARLANLDTLEQKTIKLEAENAQLRYDAATSRQDIDGLQRDVAELEELKA